MNLLVHLSAVVAAFWLSIYGFATLDHNALGLAALGLFFWWLIMAVFAAVDDWAFLTKGRNISGEVSKRTWFAGGFILVVIFFQVFEKQWAP